MANSDMTILAEMEDGTWTPTISRATLSQSAGTFCRVGRLIYLRAKIVFSSTQADQGLIYIDNDSFPACMNIVYPGTPGYMFGVAETTSDHPFTICTQNNENAWIRDVTTGAGVKATSDLIKGKTLIAHIIGMIS